MRITTTQFLSGLIILIVLFTPTDPVWSCELSDFLSQKVYDQMPENIRKAWGDRNQITFGRQFATIASWLDRQKLDEFYNKSMSKEGTANLVNGIELWSQLKRGQTTLNYRDMNLEVKRIDTRYLESDFNMGISEKAYYKSIYKGLIQNPNTDVMMIHRHFPKDAMEIGLDSGIQFKPLGIKYKSSSLKDIKGLVPLNPLLSKESAEFLSWTGGIARLTSKAANLLKDFGYKVGDILNPSEFKLFFSHLEESRKQSILNSNRTNLSNGDAREFGLIGSKKLLNTSSKTLWVNVSMESFRPDINKEPPTHWATNSPGNDWVEVEAVGVVDEDPNSSTPRFRYAVSDIDLQTVIFKRQGLGNPNFEPGRGHLHRQTSALIDRVSSSYEIEVLDASSKGKQNSDLSNEGKLPEIINPSLGINPSAIQEIGAIPIRPIAHGPAVHAPENIRDSVSMPPKKNEEVFRALFVDDEGQLIAIDIETPEELMAVCAMFGILTPEGCFK